MPPEQTSRRSLLGATLALVLGWFGLDQGSAPAAPGPSLPPGEFPESSTIQRTLSTYNAEGQLIREVPLPP